jgi:hypothetical protein
VNACRRDSSNRVTKLETNLGELLHCSKYEKQKNASSVSTNATRECSKNSWDAEVTKESACATALLI